MFEFLQGSAGILPALAPAAWITPSLGRMASSYRHLFDPSNEVASIGFRLASVPEPSSLVLTMLASGVMLMRRKR